MKRNINLLSKLLTPLTLGLLSIGGVNSASAADYVPLQLPELTDDIRLWTDGGAYVSLFPDSSQVFAGIPFEFDQDANGNTIFYGGTLGAPEEDTLVIPVNLCGVTTVYTLINTAYGAQDAPVGSVTFVGSNGDTWTVFLVEGSNVRDHYYNVDGNGNDVFVNTTTDPSTTEAVFGNPDPLHAHFDMQAFTLPSEFEGQMLTEILFYSVGSSADGKAFIAAATAEILDTEPPVITSVVASPNVLWEPNHKMVPVELAVTATDDGDVTCEVVSVTCNELVNEPGSGRTSPDWEIAGNLTVNLRAERSGPASDRVYTITVQCTDSSCNTSTATVDVIVPHDQGN